METNRLEAFADGVFAIAATLLILNVDTQIGGSGDLGAQLRHAWPSYIGYAVSFLTIGIMWVQHHSVMAQLDRVDRTFLMLNVLLLMCIAFVPFPTRLAAEHARDHGAKVAALAYGGTLTVTAIFFNGVWFYAAGRRRLLRPDADPRVVRGISRSYRPGPFIYLAGTLMALARPAISLILYGAFAVFYMAESSLFARGDEELE